MPCVRSLPAVACQRARARRRSKDRSQCGFEALCGLEPIACGEPARAFTQLDAGAERAVLPRMVPRAIGRRRGPRRTGPHRRAPRRQRLHGFSAGSAARLSELLRQRNFARARSAAAQWCVRCELGRLGRADRPCDDRRPAPIGPIPGAGAARSGMAWGGSLRRCRRAWTRDRDPSERRQQPAQLASSPRRR
jgi:hypothetical protein